MLPHHAPWLVLAAQLLTTSEASASELLKVVTIEPATAWREAATVEVALIGDGFEADSIVRFFIAGTDKHGGISVKRTTLQSSRQLMALVEIDSSVTPAAFDIEVQDGGGRKSLTKGAFLIEPYSWATRFGCTGAEVWRRRVACRRR